MITEAINRILQLAEPVRMESNGIEYVRNGAGDMVMFPEPSFARYLEVATLTGIVDYLKNKLTGDGFEPSDVLVRIASPTRVDVVSTLTGINNSRHEFVRAGHQTRVYPFGQFLDLETFNISLQTMFVQTAQVADILKITGNISDGEVATYDDDGVTQQVTAKAGIKRVGTAKVPNPVTLEPYRTFPEIVQPDSQFVLRLRRGAEAPVAALFDCGEDFWKMAAISSIKQWLVYQLGDSFTVIM